MENNSTINQNIQQLEIAILHITKTIQQLTLFFLSIIKKKQFNKCKTIQQSSKYLNFKKIER